MEPALRKASLDALDEIQVENCLRTVMKGLTESQRKFQEFVACDPQQIAEARQNVAKECGKPLAAVAEPTTKTKRKEASKLILDEMANDERMAPRIDAWLSDNRHVMVE